jgi:hypothetical protein
MLSYSDLAVLMLIKFDGKKVDRELSGICCMRVLSLNLGMYGCIWARIGTASGF